MKTISEITIGKQVWASENLNVHIFNNGDLITEARNNTTWINQCEKQQGCWCFYGNSKMNSIFGKIYNRYALIAENNIIPEGWRLPSLGDFEILETHLKNTYTDYPGDTLKSKKGWEMNNNGNNKSNFGAKPGGYRLYDGNFENLGWGVWFWLLDGKFEITSGGYSYGTSHEHNGAYVRLIR